MEEDCYIKVHRCNDKVYRCDPDKYKECPKTNCYRKLGWNWCMHSYDIKHKMSIFKRIKEWFKWNIMKKL